MVLTEATEAEIPAVMGRELLQERLANLETHSMPVEDVYKRQLFSCGSGGGRGHQIWDSSKGNQPGKR